MSTETATATNGVEATPDVKSTSTPVSADKGKSPESATKKGAASDPEDDSESGESKSSVYTDSTSNSILINFRRDRR